MYKYYIYIIICINTILSAHKNMSSWVRGINIGSLMYVEVQQIG